MTARIVVVALAAGAACGPMGGGRRADSVELAAREARLSARLAGPPDSSANLGKPVARWILPEALDEISGLALTGDGHLLTHNDERAVVTVLDPRRGALVGRFAVGNAQMHGDFEGITVAEGHVYMVTSKGTLYEFPVGNDSSPVPYSLHDTQLAKECEFEGVAFDSAAHALVLACKRVGSKDLKDHLVLYRWSLDGDVGNRLTTVTVPMAQVLRGHDWQDLHPSDITVDPSSGNYVIVAAQEQALVELTPSGTVVRTIALPNSHKQAEGVAISPDGLLIVSDEANTGPATITLYRWRSSPAATVGST
jgi:uncharacterized protein YjiK